MSDELTSDLLAFAKGLILWAAPSRLDAEQYALERAAALRELGDMEGHRTWLEVAAAVKRLRSGLEPSATANDGPRPPSE